MVYWFFNFFKTTSFVLPEKDCLIAFPVFASGVILIVSLSSEYSGIVDFSFGVIGCNDSNIHVDFMFGSSDMTIVGTKHDGSQVVIFKDGKYVI